MSLYREPNFKKRFKFDHVWPMLEGVKKYGDDNNTAQAMYHKQSGVNIASSAHAFGEFDNR